MRHVMEQTRDIQHKAEMRGETADSSRSVRENPTGGYDPVDLRLMDTFPASDAVARY